MRSLALVLVSIIVLACPISSARAEQEVVGGSPVPSGRWPDAVAVLMRDGFCTGTLIAPDVVLTAGHCIDAGPLEVIVDTIDHGRAGGQRIRVAWARAYPNWPRRYDIGVLMLDEPARAKPRKVTSACTARELLVRGRRVEIVGFGLATAQGLDSNTRLHQATVPVTDPTCTLDPACEPSVAPHGEFMAGGHGADSCFGDSGGPVYVATNEGMSLIGVVSRGLALPAAPCGNGGVYVRVDKVIAWVQSVTGRKLERTTCEGRGDEFELDGDGGCAAGSGVGGYAALVLLLCAWLLHRRDRLKSTISAVQP
ncbi:MAG: serine protease [Myxococcota bacterium]|nr:serine protease [Myxococcota bacterium]